MRMTVSLSLLIWKTHLGSRELVERGTSEALGPLQKEDIW